MILFLVAFVGGIALSIWMIRQAAKSGQSQESHEMMG
jgi:hypothetical protein